MILIIDNHDSFTYNLVQYVGSINPNLKVFMNDQISIEEVSLLSPKKIIISPGPGKPEDAGISIDIIQKFGEYIPILGICLGHQAIASAFGGCIVKSSQVIHGKTSIIYHFKSRIFKNIPLQFEATRYHSLIVEEKTFPSDSLAITARTEDGLIMALEHKKKPIYGLQFHPESIVTEYGMDMIRNFIYV